jgi:DNA-binding IclR family transcriptional regulator
MSDSHIDEIVDIHGLPQATENTIIEREALKKELDRIADRGYALEDEEHWENIRAVAVPIIFDSAVQGAISITGPTTRFDESRIEELVDMLHRTKNIIELRLEHYQ